MCGIAGVLMRGAAPETSARAAALVRAMNTVQAHRGPDGDGVFATVAGPSASIALGHLRLAILDPTPTGAQPFVSPCGRWRLVYNGELYNFVELARELEGDPRAAAILRASTGDTAVVLAALTVWGPETAFSKFNGMWALALWDNETATLTLSRDRVGIKPLYLWRGEDRIVFASEVKGILAAAERRFAPDAGEIGRYLAYGLTNTSDRTFFEGIVQLPAGSWMKIDCSRPGFPPAIEERRFWEHPHERGVEPRAVSPDEVRALFLDAVRVHLRSDVPVGVTLSGGLDSSAIFAAARHLAPQQDLTALSVESADPQLSERPFVDMVIAASPGRLVTLDASADPAALFDEIPDVTWHADQPLKSFSSLGLARLCRFAREAGIIVMLNGQGADEQLCGYNKYLYLRLNELVRAGRIGPAAALAWRFWRNGTVFGEFRLAEAKRYIPGLLKRTTGSWLGPQAAGALQGTAPTSLSGVRGAELADMTRLSIPHLLHDEDRMSMRASTEMRVPFLDWRLIELLATVPPDAKLAGGWTKAIFREAMRPLLPKGIVERKDKKGFTLPQEAIFRGPVRGRFEEVFGGPMLSASAGFVDQAKLKAAFEGFLGGSRFVAAREMFRAYALEAWMRRFEPHLAAT